VSVTLADLRTKLTDWLQITSDRMSASVQTDLINLAQKEILRDFDLGYEETSDTFATVVGTETYTPPATFQRPLLFWYYDSTGALREMTEVSRARFIDKYKQEGVSTGPPAEYAIWDGIIYLGPTPDAVYTINREYMQTFVDLSADSDHNDLTDNAWELLLYKALILSSDYTLEDGRTALWQARFREVLGALLGAQVRTRTAGAPLQTQEPG
jgi:hypothetical protein